MLATIMTTLRSICVRRELALVVAFGGRLRLPDDSLCCCSRASSSSSSDARKAPAPAAVASLMRSSRLVALTMCASPATMESR